MKDISIELEEAGLDPFDNSNLQGYVDDTHHFGEEIITSLKVEYGKQLHEEAEALLMGTNTGKQAVGLLRPQCVSQLKPAFDDNLLNIGWTDLKESYPYRFGIDLASGPDLTSLGLVTKNDDGSLNFDMESGGLFSRHMIVNARTIGKSFMRQQLRRIHRQLERYSYSGRRAKGRLQYDVIDSHTREVVNTYRQVKKAKALVKELNRG